ncbi:hypothetical protein OXX59_008803 [Metschnikowia pulcherrima]
MAAYIMGPALFILATLFPLCTAYSGITNQEKQLNNSPQNNERRPKPLPENLYEHEPLNNTIPSDSMAQIEIELENFGENLNRFLESDRFNYHDFGPRILMFQKVFYGLDFTLERLSPKNAYSGWLLTIFGQQFHAMIDGAERMQRYSKHSKNNQISHEFIRIMIELRIVAIGLSNLVLVSPIRNRQIEHRILQLQCKFLSEMDGFSKRNPGKKLRKDPVAGYVKKTETALRGVKGLLHDSSNWGICP